jgi:hypothetical protein
MRETLLDQEPVVLSKDAPVSLLEVYHDAIIEYGVQYGEEDVMGLLIRNVPHKKLTYNRLAQGAFCIYASRHSDTRFLMPSPNVQLEPLTVQHFGDTQRFASMRKAFDHPQLINSLTEVSLDVYVSLWRSVGANIGRKVGELIVWEKSFLRNFKVQCLH